MFLVYTSKIIKLSIFYIPQGVVSKNLSITRTRLLKFSMTEIKKI